MAKDLEKMSRDELQKLRQDLDRTLADFDSRKKADARSAAEATAREHGYSLAELMGDDKKSSKKSPAKYRNPADPKQTWTGRGRQPAWLKEALESGKSRQDFAI